MNLHKNFATLSHSKKQEKKLFEITLLKRHNEIPPLRLPKSDNKIPAFNFA